MIRSMRSGARSLLMMGATLAPLPAHAAVHAAVHAPAKLVPARSVMARIPAGSYRPLYAPPGVTRIGVHAFALDRTPVTRGAYLRFVLAKPEWSRAAVQSRLADAGYLADWPSASSAGGAADMERPVTGVSQHAAAAYCSAQGKRLPTLDEWELAAAASESARDAGDDPAFRRRLAAVYAARRPGVPARVGSTFTNVYGVSDLHGLVWEWTADVGASPADHAGHHAAGGHLYCASSAMGATDPTDYPAFLRYAVRAGLTARSTVSGVGFRCAAGQVV